MDKTKLILAVKKYPCLWDHDDKYYRNKEKQQDAWTRILEEINPKFCKLNPLEIRNECLMLKGKWINLSYYYKKAVSEAKKNIHENLLTFLKPTFNRKCSNVEAEKSKVEEKTKISNADKSMELSKSMTIPKNDICNNINRSSTKNNNKNTIRNNNNNSNNNNNKIKRNNIDESSSLDDTEIVKNYTNINHQIVIQEEEEDDQKFLLSFRSDIKNMNKDEKLEFKIEMLQLVRKIKNKRQNYAVTIQNDNININNNNHNINNSVIKDEFESFMMYPMVPVNEIGINKNGRERLNITTDT